MDAPLWEELTRSNKKAAPMHLSSVLYECVSVLLFSLRKEDLQAPFYEFTPEDYHSMSGLPAFNLNIS